MPLEALGLIVEVEIDIMEPVHLLVLLARFDVPELLVCGAASLDRLLWRVHQDSDHLLISLLDAFLSASLVDKVDQIVLAVYFDLLVKVFFCCLNSSFNTTDLQLWRVMQVVDFSPKDGNAASRLQGGKDLSFRRLSSSFAVWHALATRIAGRPRSVIQ